MTHTVIKLPKQNALLLLLYIPGHRDTEHSQRLCHTHCPCYKADDWQNSTHAGSCVWSFGR